jgi:cell division cycle 2-like protein
MSTNAKSRWANDEEDAALEAKRKREKEEKKRAKLEKQRKLDEASKRQQEENEGPKYGANGTNGDIQEPLSKRRQLSPEFTAQESEKSGPVKLLRFPAPEWGPCRSVENYEKLNHIEEGTYGWVSRAKDIATGEIVALKKLKMDEGMRNDGFPVTGLREIQTLKASQHPHIVNLREVVMGAGISK